MTGRAISTLAFCAVTLVAAPEVSAREGQAEPPTSSIPVDNIKALTELSLEDLLNIDLEVYAATKTATKATAVAASLTVITREDLELWGYASLAEALAHHVGFYVLDDFTIPNIGMRGVSGSLWGESGTIKVMIDGHSVAFRSTGGNWLGVELIPLSAISHIEIIRGPVSSLYGADAFLGLINIVTRGYDGDTDLHLRGGPNYVQTNTGGDLDAAVVARLGPVDVLAAMRLSRRDYSGLSLPSSSPQPVVPYYREGSSSTHDLRQDSAVGLLELSFASDPFSTKVSGYWSMIERGAELSPWLQLGNGTDPNGRDTINRVALAHGHIAADFSLATSRNSELKLNATYFQGQPTQRDHIEVGVDTFYVRREFAFRGLDTTLEGHWHLGADLNIIVGGAYLYDFEQMPSVLKVSKESGEQPGGITLESASLRQGTRALFGPAVFLIAQWQPLQRYLGLQASARVDYHNVYGLQPATRLGLVSEPVQNLTLKLMYGNAFKAPSPLLLYGRPLRPGDIVGNPDLAAQHIHTAEVQGAYLIGKAMRIETGLAASLLLDKAEFRSEGANQIARNVTAMKSLSFETTIEGFIREWAQGYLRLSMVAATRESDDVGYTAWLFGDDNVGYPPITVAGGVTVNPMRHLKATLEGRYLAARPAQESNIMQRSARYELPDCFIVDASIAAAALELLPEQKTTLSLLVRNVLDDHTPDPGFAGVDYPRAPRSFFVTLQQEL